MLADVHLMQSLCKIQPALIECISTPIRVALYCMIGNGVCEVSFLLSRFLFVYVSN